MTGQSDSHDIGDYYAQNGSTAIRVAFALGGAYIGITNDVREFPGGERAQIKVTPDQAREIARSLIAIADKNNGVGS